MKAPIRDPGFYLTTSPVNGGFSIKFANNYTVSVRWGSGSYADQITDGYDFIGDLNAQTAEVGMWREDENGNPVWHRVDGFDYGGDDVLGHLTPDHVAEIIRKVSLLD